MKEFILKAISKIAKNEFHPGGYWGTEIRFMLSLYETESIAVCKKFIKPGMNVLDVGSDIGYYSKIFSKLVKEKGRIYSFEPHPLVFKIMLKNLKSLKHQNVYPVQAAVSDINGKFFLFEAQRHGWHSLFDISGYNKSFKTVGKIEVDVVTIDNFLFKRGNPKIDFFKIDVEGGEINVLNGMKRTIEKNNKIAGIVEFNANALLAAGQDPFEYIDKLQGFGFKVKEIAKAGRLKDVDKETYREAEKLSVNLFCFKGEQV